MPENVLVVEDNERNRRLLSAVLEVAGMSSQAVATGLGAVDHFASALPDLVLLDIQLPDIDGIEVLARLRQLPGGADVPVIALTAFAMEGDEARFRSAGFDGYLSKPIDVRCFADQVRGLLAERVLS
jgi:two-component system cell cycle response regulator DivK